MNPVKHLALLSLQSFRYGRDTDFCDAVDNALIVAEELDSFKLHLNTLDEFGKEVSIRALRSSIEILSKDFEEIMR